MFYFTAEYNISVYDIDIRIEMQGIVSDWSRSVTYAPLFAAYNLSLCLLCDICLLISYVDITWKCILDNWYVIS